MAVKQLIQPAETPCLSRVRRPLDEQSRVFDMSEGEKKRKTVFRQEAEKEERGSVQLMAVRLTGPSRIHRPPRLLCIRLTASVLLPKRRIMQTCGSLAPITAISDPPGPLRPGVSVIGGRPAGGRQVNLSTRDET